MDVNQGRRPLEQLTLVKHRTSADVILTQSPDAITEPHSEPRSEAKYYINLRTSFPLSEPRLKVSSFLSIFNVLDIFFLSIKSGTRSGLMVCCCRSH
ncbi:hypothetical protein L6452_43010 [Arctium lappa]|uniref:Uncharacterized protein n=1 Tax=Arctium lappa TaxID=4217 RepID=A0ACB8XJV1_ARCLA|nr:hypothetical protein L6452_43010 [Arctium lappa]